MFNVSVICNHCLCLQYSIYGGGIAWLRCRTITFNLCLQCGGSADVLKFGSLPPVEFPVIAQCVLTWWCKYHGTKNEKLTAPFSPIGGGQCLQAEQWPS